MRKNKKESNSRSRSAKSLEAMREPCGESSRLIVHQKPRTSQEDTKKWNDRNSRIIKNAEDRKRCEQFMVHFNNWSDKTVKLGYKRRNQRLIFYPWSQQVSKEISYCGANLSDGFTILKTSPRWWLASTHRQMLQKLPNPGLVQEQRTMRRIVL